MISTYSVQLLLSNSWLKDTVTELEEGPYFRLDTDDSDSRQQWDNYVDVSNELREHGLRLDDPYTEHDCITGIVIINDGIQT